MEGGAETPAFRFGGGEVILAMATNDARAHLPPPIVPPARIVFPWFLSTEKESAAASSTITIQILPSNSHISLGKLPR